MSNTTTKVNSFIALGYSFLASETQIRELLEQEPSEESVEEEKVLNNVEEDSVLNISNDVIKTINYQVKPGGLRV
jgi:hypothetical protein